MVNTEDIISFKFLENDIDSKPIISVNIEGMYLRVLIDTGSDRNMWLGSKFMLSRVSRKCLGRLKAGVSGLFGNSCAADGYITFFDIGLFHWDNVLFILPDNRNWLRNFDVIIGSTMLQDFAVIVDYYKHIVQFVKRDLRKTVFNDAMYESEILLNKAGKSMFVSNCE